MTPAEKRILAKAVRQGGCPLHAEELLTVADMIRKGWLAVQDQAGAVWYRPTDAGVRAALAFGVIQ